MLKNWIYIQTTDDEALPEVLIHDASGRSVRRFKPQIPTVDLDGLPEGFYTITFILDEKIVSEITTYPLIVFFGLRIAQRYKCFLLHGHISFCGNRCM